jgi:hypothetical protein
MNDQISKIQQILGKSNPSTAEDKIKAINHWYEFEGESKGFDMSMVDSFAERIKKGSPLTANQTKALDKIISGFGINLKEHL